MTCDSCGDDTETTVVLSPSEPYGPPASFCDECMADNPNAVPAETVRPSR